LIDITKGKLVDLTHSFSSDTIYWPTESDGFQLETEFAGQTEKGYYYAQKKFAAPEHGGTHLDAPIHFFKDGDTVEQIPLEKLVGSAIVIDVSDKALDDSDYQVTVDDIVAWESEHGTIHEGAIVLVHTGYGQFWPDRQKYMGTKEIGEKGVGLLHFPGLHPDAARWLVENRKINALGLDTCSVDYGQSKLFQTHRTLFENNILAFENVANLDKLPPTGSHVIALPMKIEGGSGAPLRIIATIPDERENFDTETTAIGQDIKYPSGTPEITSKIVTIPVGAETGQHIHEIPMFSYMMEGQITVDYGEQGTKTYAKGDSLVEAMHHTHNGKNTGDVPAKILVVLMDAE